MGGSKPGNAGLPTGALQSTNREIGAPVARNGGGEIGMHEKGNARGKGAIQENGVGGGWHSRGYLPHFESADVIQHVTFHLADSLPKAALSRLAEELKFLPDGKRHVERRERLDAWMDQGCGSCILREPRLASTVEHALVFFDAKRYRLLAWVVMPNHVHILFQPINGWTVAKIVASWKKYTARRIRDDLRNGANREIGVPGAVWHREYWDRYIRNERHFRQALEYIHTNPVKAGLVSTPEDWPWSSAATGRAKAKADPSPPSKGRPGSG